MSGAVIPELPAIDNIDLLFEVLSLRREGTGESHEWNDNQRLAELGKQVLSNVVTLHYFSKRPIIRAEEIRVNFGFLSVHLSDFIACCSDMERASDLAQQPQRLVRHLSTEREVARSIGYARYCAQRSPSESPLHFLPTHNVAHS